MVLMTRHTDFIQTEADVNQEHQRYRDPVIELGKHRDQSIKLIAHLSSLFTWLNTLTNAIAGVFPKLTSYQCICKNALTELWSFRKTTEKKQ